MEERLTFSAEMLMPIAWLPWQKRHYLWLRFGIIASFEVFLPANGKNLVKTSKRQKMVAKIALNFQSCFVHKLTWHWVCLMYPIIYLQSWYGHIISFHLQTVEAVTHKSINRCHSQQSLLFNATYSLILITSICHQSQYICVLSEKLWCTAEEPER